MGECPANNSFISNFSNNRSFFNSSSSFFLHQPYSNDSVEMLKFIAYGAIRSVIITLGILGNIINLIVLTRPNLKGVTFTYLTWLAISDLMALIISISSMFKLRGMQPRSYVAAVYYAHIEMPLVNAFMASSVFMVVALTIDRYFSVCAPTKFKDVHNIKRAKRSIAAAYLCAFLLYIPVCFQKNPIAIHFENKIEFIACDYAVVATHAAFKVYLMIKEGIVRIGPVILLAILNITIIVTFRKTLKKKDELLNMCHDFDFQPRNESSKAYKDEQRLIILLVSIVILFFICMTPAAILMILITDDKEFSFGFQLFRAIANVLELSNFAMNFYVYCICSSEIRRTFISLFKHSRPLINEGSDSSKPSVESIVKY